MRYDFYAFMDRMKYIKRWQLMRSEREENIMEHSQSVAMFAHALAIIKNKYFGGSVDVSKTVLYAMYHETSEVVTGDLPTPVKYYNKHIHGAYKELERTACENMLTKLPEEMREEITPKNILMMGPTGCGKTEIARRLAKLMDARGEPPKAIMPFRFSRP